LNSIGFTVRRAISTSLMQLSDLPLFGGLCTRLAGAMRGPYKDKRVLAYLTARPYISPRAQIHCPRLTVGPHCFIDDYVTIYAHEDGGEVRLGEGVHLYRGTIVEIGHGGSVVIGDHSHVQSDCNIKGFGGSTIIGKHVQIAPHCGFSPYEHGVEDVDRPIREQPITWSGDIVLGDDVWLGLNVQVLDGVEIGHGAVIGAGAVVTESIPPNCIAVGVPARVVRRRGQGA